MEKPTLPKGTRDFGPAQMAKRQFIFESIKKVFQKYGFQPLETPAMENLSTLTGKYGEEGDQLLFKIQNSGDKFSTPINFHTSIKDRLKDFLSSFFIRTAYSISGKEIQSISEMGEKIPYLVDEKFRKNEHSKVRDVKEHILNNKESLIQSIEEQIKNDNGWPEDMIALLVKSGEFSEVYNNRLYKKIIESFVPYELMDDISEKGLRYDLTVPFARYVVMNRGEMTFPFKRYQIQPVWRADRPQKGRYREFYQCDADVVGTDSLICEAEIVLMINEVFNALGIHDYTIKINHRGVLAGLAELAGAKENQMSLFVAIDKLDKIGEAKVKEELIGKGFSESSLDTVFEILNFKGTTAEKVALLTSKFASSDNGNKGIKDLTETFDLLTSYGTDHDHVELDIALARGLSYYTGCIFEVKINNVAIGSVSGGGRYDNLTGGFGLPNVSGVGISFGVDRLYDAMEELKVFPESTQASSKVLLCHFDEESKRYGLKVVQTLRTNGIASEIYPDSVKINKQLDYANKKMIPYTIVIGSDEVKSGVLSFKDMKKGEQSKLSIEEILNKLTVDK